MSVILNGTSGITYNDGSNTPAANVTTLFGPSITDTSNVIQIFSGTRVYGNSGIKTTQKYYKSNPGSSGILTSSGSFVVPAGVSQVKIVAIGGGGSGGGGTGRTNNTGPYTGGGGGGAGAAATYTLSISGATTIYYNIGAGGASVGGRDGGYSGAVPGNAGGDTWVSLNSNGSSPLCYAKGGGGGGSSIYASDYTKYATGGSGGTVTSGTSLFSGQNGGVSFFAALNSYGVSSAYIQLNGGGGDGGQGYIIIPNPAIDQNSATTITQSGITVAGGQGNDSGGVFNDGYGNAYLGHNGWPVNGYNGYFNALSGSATQGYGSGGGGGGKDNEYWGGGYVNSGAGYTGCVYIYWGD